MTHRTLGTPALAVILTLGLATAATAAPAAEEPATAGWLRYHDELFDVRLEYPADWRVVPHGGRLDHGGVITFLAPGETSRRLPEDPHDGPRRIVFGPYLTAREGGLDAATWRQLRHRRFAPYQQAAGAFYSTEALEVDGLPAVQTLEDTPLGPSRSTDIPRGSIVWFLWDDADAAQTAVYQHMLRSLRFGAGTPRAHRQLYGAEFRPASLLAEPPSVPASAQKSVSSFRVPLNGWHTAKCSDTHDKVQTEYAIDVFLPVGNYVYAAESGVVLHADWWGNYGKLLKLNSEPEEHFYGHLSNFFYTFPGSTIAKGSLVGFTGDTGIGAAHLHFEIRDRYSNTGLDMSSVAGFYENSNYPDENGVQVIDCGNWSY